MLVCLFFTISINKLSRRMEHQLIETFKLINKSKNKIILFLGKTMRDYDESFKEMKKENFNLKLRIFFLEERLGQGKKTSADELANANLELKVRI